jgi:hypothetical protein
MKNTNTLTDFIYLDIDRVRSYVAQLYQGLPEVLEEVHGNEQSGGANVGISIPLFGQTGIKGDILYQKSTSETRSFHHHLYNLFENKLNELNKVKKINSDFKKEDWVQDNFKDGSFILTQGKVQIVDYQRIVSTLDMIPRLMEIVLTFKKQELLQKRQKGILDQPTYEKLLKNSDANIPKKNDINKMAELVEKLYSGIARVKACPLLNDEKYRFVGNAAVENFSASPNNPLSAGLLSGSNWSVLGLINEPILNPVTVEQNISSQHFEDVLENLVYAMQEISKFTFILQFPAISITPVAIYRRC